MNRTRVSAGFLLAFALSACGGGQARLDTFSSHRAEDDGASLAAIAPRLASIPIPPNASVAVGVVDDGLVGIPLEGGEAWRYSHSLDTRPAVAGSVVVGMGGGELFALDALSGELLWARRAGGSLRGAGDDGRTTVVSLASKGENATTILAISHDGRVLRQLEAGAIGGVPALMGTYAFFPWQDRQVTLYELTSGREIARLALPTTASRAFTVGQALFFGEDGVVRFEPARIGESSPGSFIAPPSRALPGSPKWFSNGTSPMPVIADMRDKIRLYARPTATGLLAIEGGTFIATYFKLVMGLDAESGATTWVYAMPHEILGGASYVGGSALCDSEGTISFVDQETGGITGSVSLGHELKACVVQADGFTQPRATTQAFLPRQLGTAISEEAPELVAMQRELLRELTGIEDDIVTQTLIEIASSEATSHGLLSDVHAALAARRNGATYMLEALERREDDGYLQGELSSLPLGALAEALAAMDEKRAAPLLARHLLDPAMESSDIERAARALVSLAGPDELTQLRAFFALHRATADDEALVRAVAHIARAIVDIAEPEGRALIERGIADPTTLPEIKEQLARLLEGRELPQQKAAARKQGSAGG